MDTHLTRGMMIANGKLYAINVNVGTAAADLKGCLSPGKFDYYKQIQLSERHARTNIHTLLYQWRAYYFSDRTQMSLSAYSCLFAFIFDRKVRFGRSRNSSLQLKTRKAKTERGRMKSRQRVDDPSRDRFIRPLELIFENEKRTVCHR
jgi:hypothetical protein